MQATMLPFPYSLSRPPFMDMPDSIKSSPSGTPSPPAVGYPSRFETFLNGGNGRSMWHGSSYGQTRFEPAQFTSDSIFVKQNYVSRKKSFTIEAILGLNGYDEDSCGKPERDLSRPTRVTDVRRQERLQTPAPYGVPTATPRSALTAVYSTKENKSTAHRIGTEALNCPEISDRLSNPSSNNSSCNTSASLRTSAAEPRKSTSSAGKSKRIRTIFTPEQLERLETEFERQQYMVGPERLYLASALSLTEAQVKVWFQNRRIKWRKQHLEMQHARLAQLRDVESVESSETEGEPPVLTEERVHSPSCLDELV